MLLRTIRQKISLAYFFSAQQQQSQILNALQSSTYLQQVHHLNVTQLQEAALNRKTITAQLLQKKSINFAKQVDGKTLALICKHNFRKNISIYQALTGALGVAFGYQLIMGSMNYVTLGITGIGMAACLALCFSRVFLRKANLINDIQIGKDGLIHISYFKKGQYGQLTKLAVQKSNFKYNAIYPSQFVEYFARNQNGLWCQINNEFFWVNREGLKVNNMNFHNLL